MWQGIITSIASAISRETLGSIARGFLESQVRKTFRRSIRDVLEDEVVKALVEKGISYDEAKKYVRKRKSEYKDEIRARFDSLLLMMSSD